MFKRGQVVRIRKITGLRQHDDLEAWTLYGDEFQVGKPVGSFSSLGVGVIIDTKKMINVTMVKVHTVGGTGWIYGDLVEVVA